MFPVHQRPMYRFLIVLTMASAVGLQGWRTLFNNFAVEVVQLDGSHVGLVQAVREIPGFLTLLAIYVMLLMREHLLSALSILCLGAGVALTGLLPSYGGLLLTTLIMSVGFHFFETTNQSLTLQYFAPDIAPRVFARQRSLAAVSNIAVGLLILGLKPMYGFSQLFVLIGALVMAAGLWALRQDPTHSRIVAQRKKMILRRRYWLFYLLTFLSGARRQIFVAFAVFLLVKKFAFSVEQITLLFMLNNLVNYFASPLIGKAIVRFGERKVLSLEYASLVAIFMAYAFVDSKMLVALLYVLDHVFFNFAIAIRTYFQKVGDPRDIAPSMAVGFTINHIAAVVLPAVGGWLWMIDYRTVFLAGAFLSAISLAATQLIQSPPPASPSLPVR